MPNKKIANHTNFILFIIVIIGFVGVFNYLLSNVFVRFDLTENKVYTISKASKKIMKNLDDLITVKVYISEKNLPPLAINMTRTIKDLLSEYEAYSGGNLNVEYYDPTDKPDIKSEAQALGLREVPMQIIEKDKQQNVMCFMGLAVLYGDKKEIMPVLNNIANLEYDLSSRILKVTRTEVKSVGFYFGNGTHSFSPSNVQPQQRRGMQGTYDNLKKSLQEQFEVKTVTGLEQGQKISPNITTLIVAGLKSISEIEKVEIDQFVMRGGKLVALVDGVEINTNRGLTANLLEHGFNDMLSHYGAKVNSDLVADASHGNIQYQMNYGGFNLPVSKPYPLWVRVTKNGMNLDNPAVSNMASMTYMWSSSVSSTISDTNSFIKYIPLMTTTEYGKSMVGNFDLNPEKKWDFRVGDRKKYHLASLLSGTFNSFYKGKSIATNGNPMLESSPTTTIVLIGDSDFLSDGNSRENVIFMNNLIEWLTLGDNLISIRTKSLSERRLDPQIEASTKSAIKIFNTIIMPLLVILIGLVVLLRKKKLINKGVDS